VQVTNQKLSPSSRYPQKYPLDPNTTDPNILLAAQFMNMQFGNLGPNAVGVLAAMSDLINTSFGYVLNALDLGSTAPFDSALHPLKLWFFFISI